MKHLAHIELLNYRSFSKASCRLSPLTLVVGRNNSGKTNLVRAFHDAASQVIQPDKGKLTSLCHYQREEEYIFAEDTGPVVAISLTRSDGSLIEIASNKANSGGGDILFRIPEIYDFDPRLIGAAEPAESAENVIPRVLPDGRNVTSVLRRLRLGDSDQQRRFETIKRHWQECLPEVKNLHFSSSGPMRLMVEQDSIPGSRPLSDLSEGARLMLAMLTLVYQERPPGLILLEDFDHKLHARLFSTIVGFLRDLTRQKDGPQIIATTHNPYLVDEFKDDPESVVIVEKHRGCSTLANMDDRLRSFLDEGESLDMPLGQALFSGLADAPPPVRVGEAAHP